MTLYYGLTEEEMVLENLTLDAFDEGTLKAGKILNDLLDIQHLPGALTRVAVMAMRLFKLQKERAAMVGASYQDIRLGQNEDRLLLACLHTAIIWECG